MNVINFSSVDGDSFTRLDFNIIGDSLGSPYVPYVYGFKGLATIVKSEDEKNKALLYNLFVKIEEANYSLSNNRSLQIPHKFENFIRYFEEFTYPVHFGIKKITAGFTDVTILQVFKGMVLYFEEESSEVKILMTLGVEAASLWKINKNNVDNSKFALFVSKDFEEERFKPLYTKIKKDLLPEVQNKGIDIVFTNNIAKWCFRNSFEMPKFGKIMELKKFLNDQNQIAIHGEEKIAGENK
jgi:hypothetical protein